MRIKVIHHADSDGYVSALVVKTAIQESNYQDAQIEFIPFRYEDSVIVEQLVDTDKLYLVDASYPPEILLKLKEALGRNFVWIDHHKSAIQKAQTTGTTFEGIQSTDEAACLLCWRYFYGVNQKAPLLVEAINKFDNWRKGEDWDSFIYPLNLCVMTFYKNVDNVDIRLLRDDQATTDLVEGVGRYLNEFNNNIHTSEARYIETRIVEQKGNFFNAYVLNTPTKGSLTFDLYMKDHPHNPVQIVYVIQGSKVFGSIYASTPEFDCSELAQTLHGGGHRGAAGFNCSIDEFNSIFK